MAERVTEVPLGTQALERFEEVLTPELWEQVRDNADRGRALFDGRKLINVNSTARGGGVAEMLLPLLSYARGAGVDGQWLVIEGDKPFFAVTKRIHNRLHGAAGDGGPLGDEERAAYEETIRACAEELVPRIGPRDAVILHDPQTAGLVDAIKETGAVVVWRCHVGLDEPNDRAREAWDFLRPYLERADALVFSRQAFVWDGLDDDRVRIITPTIDAFAPKNMDLEPDEVEAILQAAGLRAEPPGEANAEPLFHRMDGEEARVTNKARLVERDPLAAGTRYVLQVSRWDGLKDPIGVIDGFAKHIAHESDAHLIYAGPDVTSVSDDPEGETVLQEATRHWEGLDDDLQERVHLALLPMEDLEENAAIVNALQRAATVVVQKSLAEGFGLTVAEAMWKAKPVVASRIGGIQDQIEDGRSGVLLDDPEDLAAYGAAVRELLDDPERAEAMGRAAADRVRENFLGTSSLLDYLELLGPLLNGR